MKFLAVILIPIASYAGLFYISEADINSRSSGLRNSDFAVNSYTAGVISNPAFLAEQKEIYLTSSYYNYFMDINSGSITLSYPDIIFQKIPAAITLSSINYGSFDDVEAGTNYTPYEMMLVLSAGYKYRDILTGANIKYLYSSISSDYNSSGIALDISALYRFYEEKASIAIGLFNSGFQLDDYYGRKETVDTYLKTGIGYRLEKLPLKLMLQNDLYFSSKIRNSAGIEFDAKENLTVRVGYEFSGNDMNIGTNTKNEQFSGVSLGATVAIKNFGFDFAYMVNGELDNEFAMSMNLNMKDYIK